MRIAVLGTGMAGQTLAGHIASLGHEVVIGTRDPAATSSRRDGQFPFAAWHREHPQVCLTTLAKATARADLVINAISGGAPGSACRATC